MLLSIQNGAKLTAFASILFLSGCLSMGDKAETSGSVVPPTTPPPSGNSAPTITGNPASGVRVGDNYSFTPNANDADGDALTFSIQNQPLWASFDSTTGQVSGVPSLGDIGSYANISISVSDGQASTSTSNFSIDVTQVSMVSTTLSWSAPTQNEDGTTLTDLAGYKIYYGTSSRNYTNEILIENPSVTTFVVDNLSPNTYYFAATALDASGDESRYSGEAVRVLN